MVQWHKGVATPAGLWGRPTVYPAFASSDHAACLRHKYYLTWPGLALAKQAMNEHGLFGMFGIFFVWGMVGGSLGNV